MSKSTFSGPVRTGKDYGSPYTNTIGTVIAVQRATVLSGALKNYFVLPPNSEILQLDVLVDGSAGQVTGCLVDFGTSADQAKYGSVSVSAVGLYRPLATGVSGAALKSAGAADSNIVTIVASALASGAAMVGFAAVGRIYYLQGT